MQLTQAYAIAAGGLFFGFLLFRALAYGGYALRMLATPVSKYLIYPFLIRRYRFVGPWSPADVILQAVYIAFNMICVAFRVTSSNEAGERAGTLSIVNMAPLFFGPHLGSTADLLGFSLSSHRRIHRSAGTMSFALVALRIIIAVRDTAFSIYVSKNLYLVIGSSALALLIILSLHFVRKLSYEVFLRTHQILALISAFALWRVLFLESTLNRICIYVSLGIFSFSTVLQVLVILYRNNIFRGTSPRALVTQVGNAFEIRIVVHAKMKVEAGQYIGLWMPSISFWSFLQCHPFVIASHKQGEQTTLDILVQPQRGLTSKLLRHAQYETRARLALLTGPHGMTAPVGKYESVLMVASGFGIVAHLPYLQQLMRDYTNFTGRTRRVHLVWQLQNIEDIRPAKAFLDQALIADTKANGYRLRISIYCALGRLEEESLKLGKHGRVSVQKGVVNVEEFLQSEILGSPNTVLSTDIEATLGEKSLSDDGDLSDTETLVERGLGYNQVAASATTGDESTNRGKRGGEMLVTVSASEEIRDNLRKLVREYLEEKVSLLELDYQPASQ